MENSKPVLLTLACGHKQISSTPVPVGKKTSCWVLCDVNKPTPTVVETVSDVTLEDLWNKGTV